MKNIQVTSRIISLVPLGKHDHEAVERAITAGYPGVESVLPSLLEWIQDMNWPVAQELAPFLASIGLPLIPHLEKIFESDDEIWKAWTLSEIVEESTPLAVHFRPYVEKVADSETNNEDEKWLQDNARKILKKYGWLKGELEMQRL